MHRCLLSACTVSLLLVLVGFPAVLASPRVPGTFPAQALDLVPVNVRVVDRAGKPATDLKQSDFTIVENGVPQVIRHFTLETLTPATAQPGARPGVRKGISVTPQGHRVFVFALGLGRLEGASKTITELLRFVRTRLLPQDQVAIFAYGRALPFTTDHQKVAEALERFKRVHEDIDYEVGLQLGPTGMASLYGTRAISRKLQTKIDEMLLGPGATAPVAPAAETLMPTAFDELSLDDFMCASARTFDDLANLMALTEYLSRVEGEKHVLFVTEKGLQSPSDANDQALASMANDGRVSIYTLQAGGLLKAESTSGLNATHEQALSFKSLRAMADLTGGLSAITEPSQVVVDRLDEVTRTGYLLGYRSSNAAWDGTYRTITVRVARPDVTVLYRHGYRRDAQVGGFDRRGFVTNDRLSAAVRFRREVDDIKVKASATRRGGGSLAVEGKITLSRVKLEAADGARVGLLNIAIFCFDSGFNSTGAHVDTLQLKLTEEQFKQFQKSGLPFSIEFEAFRGTQNFRFIVYDYGSDLVGRVDITLF
jgi:VWFA-related protein